MVISVLLFSFLSQPTHAYIQKIENVSGMPLELAFSGISLTGSPKCDDFQGRLTLWHKYPLHFFPMPFPTFLLLCILLVHSPLPKKKRKKDWNFLVSPKSLVWQLDMGRWGSASVSLSPLRRGQYYQDIPFYRCTVNTHSTSSTDSANKPTQS